MRENMFDLTGKTAVITGSSKGIGKSIAANGSSRSQSSGFAGKPMFVKKPQQK